MERVIGIVVGAVATVACAADVPSVPSAGSTTMVDPGETTSAESTAADAASGTTSVGPDATTSGDGSGDETMGGPTGSISGVLQIVNAPADAAATVAVVAAADYTANVFPEVILRQQEGVQTDFLLEGVPAGEVYVFPSLAFDGLVADPDPNVAGAQAPVLVEVVAGETVDVGSFKMIGALAVVSPGAGDTVETVAGPVVTFEWDDDASEDAYELTLFDAGGQVAGGSTVPAAAGAATVVADIDVSAYVPGPYQFRAYGVSNGIDGDIPIAVTDEASGRFILR